MWERPGLTSAIPIGDLPEERFTALVAAIDEAILERRYYQHVCALAEKWRGIDEDVDIDVSFTLSPVVGGYALTEAIVERQSRPISKGMDQCLRNMIESIVVRPNTAEVRELPARISVPMCFKRRRDLARRN